MLRRSRTKRSIAPWQDAFSFWKGSDQDEAHAREPLSAICLRSFKWQFSLRIAARLVALRRAMEAGRLQAHRSSISWTYWRCCTISRRMAGLAIFSQDIVLHRLIEDHVRPHTLQLHVPGSRLRRCQRKPSSSDKSWLRDSLVCRSPRSLCRCQPVSRQSNLLLPKPLPLHGALPASDSGCPKKLPSAWIGLQGRDHRA